MMEDCERLEAGFEVHSKPFDKIIESSIIPTVIKYDRTQEVDPDLISPGFDPAQPYLLHSVHDVERVHARSARFQPSSKVFVDTGLDVTVDEQYDGWFAVFGSPSDHRIDPVVPHFRNIGKLSISSCETFLVSGTQPLEGMKVYRSEDGSKSLEPFNILPGAMLTKVGMYTVSLKIKVKKRLSKTKIVNKDETYLACRDELHHEMLIPCHASGIFYVISQVSGQIKTPIMKMEDILARYTFPLLVKLVHGHTIDKPSSCNGTLILLKSEQMKTTFASTIYAPRPAVIEIATDTSLRFYTFNTKDTHNIQKNNNSSAISKAYQNYSNKMPSLLQTLRFRNNKEGLASARSSSTSGHDSCLSDDEEMLDWSKITLCSNSPFIESVDSCDNINVLFTHHVHSPPPTLQTAISPGKDAKNKTTPKLKKQLSKEKEKEKKATVTTTIKKTTLYDAPKANPETIEISSKRRKSESNVDNAATTQARYENIHNLLNSPTSPTSPTATSPLSNAENSTEYTPLWSDTSSVISNDSLEVVVENVMHTDVSGNTQDASSNHEYKNLSSELAATVRIRNKSRKSLDSILNTNHETGEPLEEVEHAYDFLSDNPYRNTVRASYRQLLKPLGDPQTAVSTSESSDAYPGYTNDEGDATDALAPGVYQQRLTMNNTSTYEEPTYGNYERPRDSTYEKPREIIRTGTYEKPITKNYVMPNAGTYVDPQAGHYDRPQSETYVTATPQNYDEPGNNVFQDDGIIYESVENIYESIADIDVRNPSSEHYVNVSKSSEYMNTGNLSLSGSASSQLGTITKSNVTSAYKSPNNSGLFLNTPANEDRMCNDSILEKLLSNMKNLGLKATTEDAIRSIDPQKFEFIQGDDFNLSEIFPSVNKIDLNKISLFINGSLNS